MRAMCVNIYDMLAVSPIVTLHACSLLAHVIACSGKEHFNALAVSGLTGQSLADTASHLHMQFRMLTACQVARLLACDFCIFLF